MHSPLFKSDKERQLWIKLNAERQILFDTNSFDQQTGNPLLNKISPRSLEQALKISKNQLEFDEKRQQLRYTLEELILLNYQQLKTISNAAHRQWCIKIESA